MISFENFKVKLADVAKTDFPDSEIFLYGSRARNNATSNSDWDILILLNIPEVNFSTETKLMDACYNLELQTGEVISPLIYSKKEWREKHFLTPLFKSIENEGIRLR